MELVLHFTSLSYTIGVPSRAIDGGKRFQRSNVGRLFSMDGG